MWIFQKIYKLWSEYLIIREHVKESIEYSRNETTAWLFEFWSYKIWFNLQPESIEHRVTCCNNNNNVYYSVIYLLLFIYIVIFTYIRQWMQYINSYKISTVRSYVNVLLAINIFQIVVHFVKIFTVIWKLKPISKVTIKLS